MLLPRPTAPGRALLTDTGDRGPHLARRDASSAHSLFSSVKHDLVRFTHARAVAVVGRQLLQVCAARWLRQLAVSPGSYVCQEDHPADPLPDIPC